MLAAICSLFAFLPMATSPEAEGVSSRQVLKWIDNCERELDCLHGFVFLRHGKVIAEGSWKPYNTLEETHFLSSHSKCFVTTAVGFLVEEGKLDLDEYLVDLIPEKLPANPSENLRRVRVRDLMTMNFGCSKTERWIDDVDGDWVKSILANHVDRKPGSCFSYDSSATHLLGIIVTRRCGKPFFDFLKERLFRKIGIEKAWITYDPMGNACAAWGMNMTTREISLIGQLYLNKGVWNGERILSEQWVDYATAKHTWSGKSPTERQPNNDWVLGFGLNWWQCQHGCYRADGSAGQYTIVMPKYDAVLSINADVPNMQRVLDVVWEHFLPALAADALPADADSAAVLKKRCQDLALPVIAGSHDGAEKFLNKTYELDDPKEHIREITIERTDDGWVFHTLTQAGRYDIPVGYGKWLRTTVVFSSKKHEALGNAIGNQRVAASGAVQKDGSLKVRVLLLDGTKRMDMTFSRSFFSNAVEVIRNNGRPFKGKQRK